MRKTFTIMQHRCGSHTPPIAWAFTFHEDFNIVPDYVPTFVVHEEQLVRVLSRAAPAPAVGMASRLDGPLR